MKAAVLQARHEATFDANVATARRLLDEAAARGAGLALLPEYWFVEQGPDGPPSRERTWAAAEREPEIRALLADWSAATGMTVAGNALRVQGDALENVLHVADGGRVRWTQTKLHPMPGEAAAGVRGGHDLGLWDVRGARVGALVCADVLYPEAARMLGLRGVDVVLNPVMSRWRAVDPTKDAREAVFVARAWDNACFVLKASGFVPRRVAGRSLVAAPWGLLARYRDEAAEEVLVADLDLDALAAFRKEQRGLQGRRPDAYRALVDDGPDV